MTDFSIKIRELTNNVISCFIPFEDDGGAGWGYEAYLSGENLVITDMGTVPVEHLPSLIELLTRAKEEDSHRSEDLGSPEIYTTICDDQEEFQKTVTENNGTIVGINQKDLWAAVAYSAVQRNLSITPLTLMRVESKYILLQGGNPRLDFAQHELEAVIKIVSLGHELFHNKI